VGAQAAVRTKKKDERMARPFLAVPLSATPRMIRGRGRRLPRAVASARDHEADERARESLRAGSQSLPKCAPARPRDQSTVSGLSHRAEEASTKRSRSRR